MKIDIQLEICTHKTRIESQKFYSITLQIYNETIEDIEKMFQPDLVIITQLILLSIKSSILY